MFVWDVNKSESKTKYKKTFFWFGFFCFVGKPTKNHPTPPHHHPPPQVGGGAVPQTPSVCFFEFNILFPRRPFFFARHLPAGSVDFIFCLPRRRFLRVAPCTPKGLSVRSVRSAPDSSPGPPSHAFVDYNLSPRILSPLYACHLTYGESGDLSNWGNAGI